ncbi:hypothetical protein CCH79_00016016, partial [Gambusia affinis]
TKSARPRVRRDSEIPPQRNFISETTQVKSLIAATEGSSANPHKRKSLIHIKNRNIWNCEETSFSPPAFHHCGDNSQ